MPSIVFYLQYYSKYGKRMLDMRILGTGMKTIRNGEIFWMNNNWEETRLFHIAALVWFRNPQNRYRGKVEWSLDWNWTSLWPFPISIPSFYLNHFSEKGLTTKWCMLVWTLSMQHPSTKGFATPCFHTFLIVKVLYLSKKKIDKEPFDDAGS